METVSVVFDGQEYTAHYEVIGDTLMVCLPDDSIRETILNGLIPKYAAKTHLMYFVSSLKKALK